MSSSSFSSSEEQLWSPLRGFFSSVPVLLTKEYHTLKWWICYAPPYPRKVQGNHCFGSWSWLSPQIPHLKTAFLICEAELPPLECVLYFLPIHSGRHVRWTYQPGSHRRKVTQDFSSTFFLRCVPSFFSREGFSHSFPSSTMKSNFVFSTRWAFLFVFFCFFVRKIPFAEIELTSQRVRRLQGCL